MKRRIFALTLAMSGPIPAAARSEAPCAGP